MIRTCAITCVALLALAAASGPPSHLPATYGPPVHPPASYGAPPVHPPATYGAPPVHPPATYGAPKLTTSYGPPKLDRYSPPRYDRYGAHYRAPRPVAPVGAPQSSPPVSVISAGVGAPVSAPQVPLEPQVSSGSHIPLEPQVSSGSHIPLEPQVSSGSHIPLEPQVSSSSHIPPSPDSVTPSDGSTPSTSGGGLYLSWENPQHAGGQYTWAQADQQCRQLGLKLVSLNSQQKEQEINSRLPRGGRKVEFYWTSGQRRAEAGPFFWQDGTPVCGPGQPGCYQNWGPTGGDGRPQPDNREGGENCLAVLNDFYPGEGIVWHDIACHHQKHFVCE